MERCLCSSVFFFLLLTLISFSLMSWAWIMSNCTIGNSSLLPNISSYIPSCALIPGLHYFASCFNVSDLTQTLKMVPQKIEALCLQGSVSTLPADAFGHFPMLQLLRLRLGTLHITPETFQGLHELQHLSFEHQGPCCASLFLPPEALEPLQFLHTLSFHGYCLNHSQNIQLPISLTHLTLRHSCLMKLQELLRLFPNLVPASSHEAIGSLRTLSFLEVLDLSANLQLRQAGGRALHGLQLRSLRLDGTPLCVSDLPGLGLRHLNTLSLVGTSLEKLPENVTAYFELRALDLGRNHIYNIEEGELLSYGSLEVLSLHANGLQLLPSSFLSALPQLQRLNLSMNKLGPTMALPEGLVSSQLRVLDLSHNEFYSLPRRAFSSLPQLQELWLSGNNLSIISSESLEGLTWLKTLDLSWNQIELLTPGWLSLLPTLTSLYLLGTHLQVIAGNRFQGPHSLSHLQLGSTTELEIYPPWPPTLRSLELQARGYIIFNALREEPFLFLENLTIQTTYVVVYWHSKGVHFPNLWRLTLRGCNYGIFHRNNSIAVFSQLPRLEYLHFWSDRYSEEYVHLTELPRLRVLELGNLGHSIMPAPAKLEVQLKQLPQLQVLALSGMDLKNIFISNFEDLALQLQLLAFNSVWNVELDSSLEELIPQMPQYVYFSDTTFTCQCENSWVCLWAARAPQTFVYGLEKSICRANTSDHSNRSLLSFISAHCQQNLEFQSFLASFSLVLLLIFFALLCCPRWSWLYHLRTQFHAWFWRLGGRCPRNQFHFDVFISYCEQDQVWVLEKLVPSLERPLPVGEGLRLCLPERDFGVGQDRIEATVASMEKSRAILCVLSGQALQSSWCNLELRFATYHLVTNPGTTRLLLLFLEPINPWHLHSYHRLARWLQKEDYFDLSQGKVEWDVFCERLRKRIKKAGQDRDD